MFNRALAVLISALSILGNAVPLEAQQSGAATGGRIPRIPVTIVQVSELPPEAADQAFLIVRRPDESPSDVILLRAGADRHDLSDAVRTLLTARQARGDQAATREIVRVSTQRGQGRRPELPWVGRVLADLRRAEPRAVAGIGTVRAVQIWLPPQRPTRARR